VSSELDGLTACFAGKVGAWFEREGRDRIADRAYLRQMNMAIALAASRWNELAAEPEAVASMRAWLEEVRRRAVARNAQARVEAIEQVGVWFDACARTV
jgi:hypothetical protein